VVVIPDLDAVVAVLVHGVGRMAITSTHGGGQQWEVFFETPHHRQFDLPGDAQERSGGVCILAIAGAVGSTSIGSVNPADHADQHKMTQRTVLFALWRL